MKKAILGFLALGLPIAALAANGEREFEHGQLGINARTIESHWRADDDKKMRTLHDPHVAAAGGAHSVVAAPEIDPTSAVTGLTLLLGGIMVLRGRKSRAT